MVLGRQLGCRYCLHDAFAWREWDLERKLHLDTRCWEVATADVPTQQRMILQRIILGIVLNSKCKKFSGILNKLIVTGPMKRALNAGVIKINLST